MIETTVYQPKHKIRILTAASLFDGHDAAINIMRRIMQSSGAEIIHLGHNRSALEIVDAAIQEDVQGIAITSYQGGHNEFFKYIYDLLKEKIAVTSNFWRWWRNHSSVRNSGLTAIWYYQNLFAR